MKNDGNKDESALAVIYMLLGVAFILFGMFLKQYGDVMGLFAWIPSVLGIGICTVISIISAKSLK